MTERLNRTELKALMELPRWLSGKEYASNAGDEGLMPGLEAPLEKEMAIEVNPKLSTDLYFSPLETINLFLKSVNLSFF